VQKLRGVKPTKLKDMAILNYTTSIDCEKSISEIQKCLVKHGANKIVTDYENGSPSSVTFCLVINENLIGYVLPANYSGVLKAMKNDRKVPNSKCNEQQAQKVAWRIIKDWVEAQMAIVEAQMADVAEVFLPYAVTNTGQTMYNYIQGNTQLLLSS
jgi:uncharacterized pyridoxamine 5'-phosphate oxidase family protein